MMLYAQPDKPLISLKEARKLFQNDKYKKALRVLDKLIKKEPESYEAYLLMASTYSWMDNMPKKEFALKKAVEVAPHVAKVYYRYGDFLSGHDRHYEEVVLYRQGVQNIPKDADMYYYLSNALINVEEYNEALENINKAIVLNPRDDNYYFKRGRIYENTNDYPKALGSYDQMISLSPKQALNYNIRGNFKFHKLDDYLGAHADYEKAAELDSASYAGRLNWCREEIGWRYERLYKYWRVKDLAKGVAYGKESLKWFVHDKSKAVTLAHLRKDEEALAKPARLKEVEALYQQALNLANHKQYANALEKLAKAQDILHPYMEIERVILLKLLSLKLRCEKKE